MKLKYRLTYQYSGLLFFGTHEGKASYEFEAVNDEKAASRVPGLCNQISGEIAAYAEKNGTDKAILGWTVEPINLARIDRPEILTRVVMSRAEAMSA